MPHTFYTECSYFTAAKYTREITRIANQDFKPTGMPAAYSYILLALEDYQDLSVAQLVDILGYERSSLMRILDKLVKKNLINIEQMNHKNIISLSDQSSATLKLANECLQQYSKHSEELLSQSVQSQLTHRLVQATSKLN
ncbi:MarR family transcriptional regulator [Pediococcus argentinicus]|uniref:MarR family transcriptional regulator n=1 Tax=Pediococcus argentinicus TaxID=480391 RepID=UPI00338F38BF